MNKNKDTIINKTKISRRTMLKTTAAAFVFPTAFNTLGKSADKEVTDMQEINADVCIIGGGSGGVGAALAASRNGSKVVMVEKNQKLGGTSTLGLVCNWEPGPGDAFALEIYQSLKQKDAVGITSDYNADRSKGPFGLWLSTSGLEYKQSQRRANLQRNQWHGVVFNPHAFHNVVKGFLDKTGNCRIMFDTQLIRAESNGNKVTGVTVKSSDNQLYRIKASNYIDSTGGGHLCRMIGCESMLGVESKSRFNEPSAPEDPKRSLNAISLCYWIIENNNPVRQKSPGSSVSGWVKSAHVTTAPGGGLIVNPLAMLPGIALLDMGYEKAMDECKKRVKAHWHWLQSLDTFAGFEFKSCASM
ncbi:FAD-dependent oxidoreductase, partial [Candidatus Poribacteria bacterium]|nr:FAD-dependent oxidoreductase [Candidatus Poribacteria bacterium]